MEYRFNRDCWVESSFDGFLLELYAHPPGETVRGLHHHLDGLGLLLLRHGGRLSRGSAHDERVGPGVGRDRHTHRCIAFMGPDRLTGGWIEFVQTVPVGLNVETERSGAD